ncbi:MAG: hypothetical protein V3U63_01670 [Gemmatimonadota bacterium]
MLDYTVEEMQLFVELAAKARSRRIIDDAYIAALGANAGFAGDTTPINKLAREMGFDAADARSAVSREVGSWLRAARKLKGLKVEPSEDGSGRIKGPVRAPPGASRRKHGN